MSVGEEFVYSIMGEAAEVFDNLDKLNYDNKHQFDNLIKT